MNRSPADLDKFVTILEDNWFDTVESLSTITEEQWSQLKLPLGLVNAIKKKLSDSKPQASTQAQPVQNQQDVQMEDSSGSPIRTDSKPQQAKPATNVSKEALLKEEVIENVISALSDLQNMELSGNIQEHRAIVKTLFTIVSNLLGKPMEPAVRRLNVSNKMVQQKILPYKNVIRFLKVVGFDFDRNPDTIELGAYRKEVFEAAIEGLNAHIVSLGGEVKQEQEFNPYQSSLASTTHQKMPVQKERNQIDKYDPTAVTNEIDKIRKQHEQALKSTKITDRDIKVFNIQHTGSNLKSYLMDLDSREQQRLQNLKLTEDKLDEQIEQTSALKFLAEVEKSSHFKNKRQETVEKLQKQQVYTTSLFRIRFPDDYVIQGTFGALEKIENVYAFVKEHLFIQDREFYLYETPPKKIIKDMKSTLKAARMVPSGMVWFAWTDLDQTKSTDGPFLDIAKLKDKIIAF